MLTAFTQSNSWLEFPEIQNLFYMLSLTEYTLEFQNGKSLFVNQYIAGLTEA